VCISTNSAISNMLTETPQLASLTNRKIILGISGGIAAYKSAELCRALKKAGADVIVVMTEGAQAFITPLTFQALSGNRVRTTLLDSEAEAAMGHIELARWADLILIAPLSANTLARLVSGEAPDLLTTLTLAANAPVALAPAMNQAMWADSRTADNLKQAEARGFHIFGPATGEQACGDTGPGRMLEPEQLATLAASLFETGELAGLNVCITAGPTREAIDPVRFISNHSSGKMGYALAQAAIDAGAKVTLVSGPVALSPPEQATTINIESAREMLEACQQQTCDIFIGVAAVADFRPEHEADQKLKKAPGQDEMTLRLVRNPDILATMASSENPPFCVGFAAETQNLEEYARAKLASKKLALIFANNAIDTFNSDEASATAYWSDGSETLEPGSKSELTTRMVTLISKRYHDPR
jgi:phosphopantothenoylcysteine decarboxylase/phosphopantothenate--cysteine ligase